jgi:hypothetical protein
MMKKRRLSAALFAIVGVAGAESTVIGTVETNATVYGATQNQSGLLNKQKMGVGTVD